LSGGITGYARSVPLRSRVSLHIDWVRQTRYDDAMPQKSVEDRLDDCEKIQGDSLTDLQKHSERLRELETKVQELSDLEKRVQELEQDMKVVIKFCKPNAVAQARQYASQRGSQSAWANPPAEDSAFREICDKFREKYSDLETNF
jgi:TolA-binding protein